MTIEDHCTIIPKKIDAYWIEDNDFLSEFALLKKWSPFEAACLLNNLKPSPIIRGVTRVGRVIEMDFVEYDINKPNLDFYPADLCSLANIIFRNFDKNSEVDSVEVVKWAVDNFVINEKSFLASRMLRVSNKSDAIPILDLSEQLSEAIQRASEAEKLVLALRAELEIKKTKKTGEHHEKKRFDILGAVLSEVCANAVWDGYIKDGRLLADKFAAYFEEVRDAHGLPSSLEHGYSVDNVVKTIRLSQKISSEFKK